MSEAKYEDDPRPAIAAKAKMADAAPDLYEALESILNEVMDYPEKKPYSAESYLPPHLVDRARAAIKKATP